MAQNGIDMQMRRRGASAILLVCLPVVAWAQPAARGDADPRVQAIVAAVSEARLGRLVEGLAGFGTRETMSTSTTTRGVGAARQWIFDELKRSSPRLDVSFDTHHIAAQGRIQRPTELRNVVAILPGRSARRIYVTGHYDSVSFGTSQAAITATAGGNPQNRADFDHDVDAPGANDDGSGTALTMELARVLAESGHQFDATLVFVCWAGEEQGLIGSSSHAQQLAVGKVAVEAMFNKTSEGGTEPSIQRACACTRLGPRIPRTGRWRGTSRRPPLCTCRRIAFG